MKRTPLVGALLIACASLTSMSNANAQKIDKSDAKIKATAVLGKAGPDGKQMLTLTIDIDKGWYIYANPVGNEMFEPNRTKITVKAKDKVAASINYPPGTEKTIDKDKYRVYEGRVVIQIELTRANGDNSSLEVGITVNACDKDNCLLTGTKKLNVP